MPTACLREDNFITKRPIFSQNYPNETDCGVYERMQVHPKGSAVHGVLETGSL